MQNEEKIIKDAILNFQLSEIICSNPLIKEGIKKVEIRSLTIKGVLHYQISKRQGSQIFHENVDPTHLMDLIFNDYFNAFKQVLIRLNDFQYQILIGKNSKKTFLKQSLSNKKLPVLTHNRKKSYLLEEGSDIPFLVELGIFSKNNQVIAKKYDKFRQLNRFLELIDDILPHLLKEKTLHIIDFGCGKAYLTFALYHYLKSKGYSLKITGLDLKKDVVENCQKIANNLHFTNLHFKVGDIKEYEIEEKVDMVVTLHACDTATDAAIEKAVNWGADVILSVPCCQHELLSQVQNENLQPLLKHGILKERFSALVTDAARAEILEILGYQTQIVEFIDLEHTPKNLLIRAIKKHSNKNFNSLISSYLAFKKALNITPFLEKMIK